MIDCIEVQLTSIVVEPVVVSTARAELERRSKELRLELRLVEAVFSVVSRKPFCCRTVGGRNDWRCLSICRGEKRLRWVQS